jgi:iron only hydrogenase large subunit-like protein
MNVCPTQAIRIHGGKAELTDNRCVDCGKCYRACPVGAIIVEQDDFSRIFEFEHRVALIPNVLMGQFPEQVSINQIRSVLHELGFTHIFEVEHGTRVLEGAMKQYMEQHGRKKPLISTFCPAVVRLIQVRFPGLTDNLILLKPPLDIAATYFRKKLIDEGAKSKEIGMFYITPCAAKIAAVKSPVGDDTSDIDGVINMDFIFNKVYTSMKQGHKGKNFCQVPSLYTLQPEEMLWSLTEGESSRMPGRSLAIDEINNVIEFLEKIENGENADIDFLELRACDQSCAGGILTSGNRFFTVERLRNQAREVEMENLPHYHQEVDESMESYRGFLMENIGVKKVLPRSMEKLDEDMKQALLKMQMVRDIMALLPSVDCGLCGSPTCNALAQDIAQGRAEITHCIFIQKKYEQKDWLNSKDSMEILKEIWGEEKFGSQKN